MACFSEFHTDDRHNANVSGCTDASYYTKNATSIDFLMNIVYPDGYSYDYTLYLERQTKDKKWVVEGRMRGVLTNHVNFKFTLSGRPQGLYRLKCDLTWSKTGVKYRNVTPGFMVYR